MVSILLFTLYIFINISVIAALWYFNEENKLKRLLFVMLLSALVFSGNIVTIFGYHINLGICHALNYYLICFILTKKCGQDGYIKILKDHFHLLILVATISLPIALMQNAGMIISGFISFPNLIDYILLDRLNYMVSLAIMFYIGQLIYVHSFDYIKNTNFWVDFLLRLPIVMTIQSLIFYCVQLLLVYHGMSSAQHLFSQVTELIISGVIIRYFVLLIASIPFYWVYKNKQGNKNINATS